QRFVLKNGLTLLVHEDHKAPIVAVNIWYHVGSKNEKPGRTGFAHLFEHLMFNGSEHFNDDYFQPFERIGATDQNGTTNNDRNNAVIGLAGDITPETARQKVEQYFGDIPATPPIAKQDVWIAKRTGVHREIMQDRVPQARIYKQWNIPQFGSADGDYLDLVTDVLAAGKTSRLYKRLVYDEQIATDVVAYVDLREIAGQLVIRATAKPGGDLARVERAIDEELARFSRPGGGPTPSELRRVKTQSRANFI